MTTFQVFLSSSVAVPLRRVFLSLVISPSAAPGLCCNILTAHSNSTSISEELNVTGEHDLRCRRRRYTSSERYLH